MKIKKSNRISHTTRQPQKHEMSQQLSTDVYLTIAQKDGTWYILIMGDALSEGLISQNYIQKFKKAAKSFKIKTCKMRVLLADSQLDVKMAGKEMFTLDEVEVYIDTWKFVKHAVRA